jgi:hypothetical protein
MLRDRERGSGREKVTENWGKVGNCFLVAFLRKRVKALSYTK